MATIRVTLVYDLEVEDGDVAVEVDRDPVFVAGGEVVEAWLHYQDEETLETPEEAAEALRGMGDR